MELLKNGAFLLNNELFEAIDGLNKEEGKKKTISYKILKGHNTSNNMEHLKIKFDLLTSHDITYVGIIQTARASGLKEFPLPYILTNCHNSLCAVGGTINEDDHLFGLSAAKKYGCIFVPPHQAVIHQYAREAMTGCGRMILGSDSHTRYGALGTMAIGEGGPELVKQLLNQTYDIDYPDIVGVYLEGEVCKGVGPQDIALAIIGKVFDNGFVKNRVMEFVGPGIEKLSVDYRIGIDVMTTETTCLSSIWATDKRVKEFYNTHKRKDDYKELQPENGAYYNRVIKVNLGEIRPMIAMPFHPSNVFTLKEVIAHPLDVIKAVEEKARKSLGDVDLGLRNKIRNGKLYVDQGIIAGCAGGGFENICDAKDILEGKFIGAEAYTLSIYPGSTPIYLELVNNGAFSSLIQSGAIIKTAFCGPCFGAGDTPSNQSFSIRHTTRNFPNREGSKIQNGQISSVALMDARSIAATSANKGILTSAEDFDIKYTKPTYYFDSTIYENRVYNGVGKANKEVSLHFGPNIKDWPEMPELNNKLLVKVCSLIEDEVTTTDELIPSGETSSYRSNPWGLAKYTLSRRDPKYVGRAIPLLEAERAVINKEAPQKILPELKEIFEIIKTIDNVSSINEIEIGSTIYANKPGDGSAREQAASCQRVLGGVCNIAREYATKRYRSNLINWGMLPLILKENRRFDLGDYIYFPNVVEEIILDKNIKGYIIKDSRLIDITLEIGELTQREKEIIKRGCLINYNRQD